MTIEPNYEINIAVKRNDNRYHHLAKVELGCHLPKIIEDTYKMFEEKFPKEAGFKLTLYKVECYMKEVQGEI